MAEGPVYLKKDGDFFRCTSKPDDPTQYRCDKVLECENGDVGAASDCRFVDARMTEYEIRETNDGKVEVVASIYQMVDASISSMPGSRAIEVDSDDGARGIASTDLESFLAGWGMARSTDAPAASRIGDAPRVSSTRLPGMMLSVDDQAVPVMTVGGKGRRLGPTALALSRWVEKKSQRSPGVSDSRVVVVFHSAGMRKEAEALAEEYIKAGKFVSMRMVQDEIYEVVDGADGISMRPDKAMISERGKTLTVAFLPTEGRDIPEFDAEEVDSIEDLNSRIAQNNRQIRMVLARTGILDIDEVYIQYIVSLDRTLESEVHEYDIDPEEV